MVVDTPYAEVLADVPELDELLELPVGRLGVRGHARRWAGLLRSVAGRRWDLVFDFARNERAQLLVALSGARRRAVLLPADRRLRRRSLYTDVVEITAEDAAALHAVDVNNRFLEAVGVPTPYRVPALSVREEARARARDLLDSAFGPAHPLAAGDPLLIVHPGSGAPPRRWPPEHFARVADFAVRCHGARVAVLGGPGEEPLAAAVQRAMTEAAVQMGAPRSLRVLAALLAEADLFLGNDSGPMHLAAAVGTPVCALFGAESLVTWAPLGDHGHRTFQAELPCGAACASPEACAPGDPMKAWCIRRIPVEEVEREVCRQLGETTARSRSRQRGSPS